MLDTQRVFYSTSLCSGSDQLPASSTFQNVDRNKLAPIRVNVDKRLPLGVRRPCANLTLFVNDTGHYHRKPWLLCPVSANGSSRRLIFLGTGNSSMLEFPSVP